jgi:hypothetical protein
MKALFRDIKQGFETNKERFTFTKSERSSKLRASMRLVVATRLQAQRPSFRLHTLSNTPSVRKKLHMRVHFPSLNFCLNKRLGEPTQFKTRL